MMLKFAKSGLGLIRVTSYVAQFNLAHPVNAGRWEALRPLGPS